MAHYHKIVLMPESSPETILLDLFRTNQVRERLIVAALEGV